jgi:ribonuclease Z
MSAFETPKSTELTRRDLLRYSGFALGGLALGGAKIGPLVGKPPVDDGCDEDACTCPDAITCDWNDPNPPGKSQQYSYFGTLPPFYPYRDPPGVFPPPGQPGLNTTIQPQGEDEMRITFMGSSIPPNLRRKQQMMSVFVEVGRDPDKQAPLDNFIFDCGSGVCTNYAAMNVGFGRMNKVFLNHLHGDHMSDLTHIYCFGAAQDLQAPLYVWGPGPSVSICEKPAASTRRASASSKQAIRPLEGGPLPENSRNNGDCRTCPFPFRMTHPTMATP